MKDLKKIIKILSKEQTEIDKIRKKVRLLIRQLEENLGKEEVADRELFQLYIESVHKLEEVLRNAELKFTAVIEGINTLDLILDVIHDLDSTINSMSSLSVRMSKTLAESHVTFTILSQLNEICQKLIVLTTFPEEDLGASISEIEMADGFEEKQEEEQLAIDRENQMKSHLDLPKKDVLVKENQKIDKEVDDELSNKILRLIKGKNAVNIAELSRILGISCDKILDILYKLAGERKISFKELDVII